MNSILSIKDLTKTFTLHQLSKKQIRGCQHVSFDLPQGEFIGITGRSGVGKSTVLKCLYRTYIPCNGQILFQSSEFGEIDLATARDQVIIAIRSKEIGYVSQFLNVLPRVTAKEIVEQALVESDNSKNTYSQEAEQILAHFHLPENLWDTYPNTFSGGERLRLNLAKAMVKRPRLLLLDEPTASLDEGSKESVKQMIEELKRAGTSMIGIFHDLDFMKSVVDTHYSMVDGVITSETVVS